MAVYFPKRFKASGLNYWGAYKELLLARIRIDIEGEISASKPRYEKALKAFLDQIRPKALDGGEDSYIILQERQFAELGARLRERGYRDPERLSVLRFYSLLDTIEADNRRKKEQLNKQKARAQSRAASIRAKR